MSNNFVRGAVGGVFLALALSAAPAAAEGEEEKLGLAAALGLNAATGKTTIAEGGGAIEAALLNSDAVTEAGRVIAGLVNRQVGAGHILVLARSEQVNLISARAVRDRIRALTALLTRLQAGRTVAKCTPPKDEKPSFLFNNKILSLEGAGESSGTRTRLGLPDIAAALATEINISPIPLSVDDRLLVAAVAMNAHEPAIPGSRLWKAAPAAQLDAPANQRFVIPSEIADVSGGTILTEYNRMIEGADALRDCDNPQVKAALSAVDAYATSLNAASEKSPVTPLGLAIQLEKFVDATTQPHVLRLAVEQTGGTAITSSNIWYTLGFPGAAQISSGLLASYRLVDPRTGLTKSAGFVRCAIAPMNMKNVHLVVDPEASDYLTRKRDRGKARCSYVATPL